MSSSSIAEARASQLVSHLTAGGATSSGAPAVSIVSRSHGVAVIQINNPPVNSLHPRVQQGLAECYQQACDDPEIQAVVITGHKAVFMAGADIEYVHGMQMKKGASKKEVEDFVRKGNDIFNRLENGPKPCVAAVNGTALGGGCELAMVCNARVATPNAVFGQPELNLGIIPGLGGTQRFPRLIGLQKAVQFTMGAKNIKAKDALKLGLIDAMVKPDQLMLTAGKLALDIAAGKVPRRISSKLNDKIGTYEMGGKAIIETARAGALKKNRHVPQPFAYLDAVEEGVKNGFEAGLAKEIDLMSGLVMHPVAKALMHFFFATRATTKGLPTKPQGKPIQTVAVLGGGTMGAGICIAYLLRGYKVILKEVNEQLVLAGVSRILEQLQRVAKARKLPIMMVEMMMRQLTAQHTYDGFDKVDLVVEAVLENLKLKQQIFAELEQLCPKHAILATNTSTINVEQIGALMKNAQDRLIGLHFFSPAHVMPLLEIIITKHTSEQTIALCLQMSKKIGKTPVVVGNCVGFTANRAFFPYGQAAGMLVDAGANPYQIDRALEKSGMPMGVFRMADLSGIDVFKAVSGTINGAYGDRCYNSDLGEKLFQAKRFGQKTGVGYYKYSKGKPVPDASLQPFLEQARASAKNKANVNAAQLNDEELVEATLFPVVNEALRILEEKFARTESDVDVVTVMGYGFPAWKGGILHWAANHPKGGFKYVRDRLQHFSQQWGGSNNKVVAEFFKPCNLLNQKADKQQ